MLGVRFLSHGHVKSRLGRAVGESWLSFKALSDLTSDSFDS